MQPTPTSRFRRLNPALLFTLLCCALALAAPQPNSIAGHWEGVLKLPSGELKISVDFTAAADGKLAATISIPQQGAKDLPLANVSQTGADVAFDLPNIPGDPKFRGKLSADGQKIEGTFSQGGGNLPLTLERKADPVATAKDALAGFDEVVTDAMKKFEVPGVAIAVVKGKEIVYAKGFGYRDVEKQLPVTADTLFAIGSTTKAFTTFLLGTLADEGKIEWDKPLRNYIPWFRLHDAAATERLSVRDLVTHRSGLPRHDLVWYNNYDATRENFVRRLAHLEPSADLREKYQYNNLMYLTAGYLAEVITGKTWEEAVRARILDPLGMKRTNFSVADSQKDSDFAQPYAKRDYKIIKIPFRPISNIGPAGAMNSSVNEMARWLMVHLNDGKYGDKRLAEPATTADMRRVYMNTGAISTDTESVPGGYALGWTTTAYHGHEQIGHGGAIDGFIADVRFLPRDDVGVVVLANLSGTPLPGLLARSAVDRLLGIKSSDYIARAVANRARAEQAGKEGEKKKAVARVAATQPSHKLADYAGDYEHPGYGELKIALRGDRLEATYNNITTPLEHWHYDTFNGGKVADNTFENMKFSFQTDVNGFIASVAAPFEPAVEEIVFAKKPDARLSDPAYLARFTGDYDLNGQPWKISLKGNALVLNLPGQPPMDLLPALSGDFKIKQTQVVSLHFVSDEQGKTAAIEVRQPGTVLTAKRK